MLISISAFLCIFLFGCIYIQYRDISNYPKNILQINDDIEYYEATVIDAPDTTGKFCKVLSEIKRIRSYGTWQQAEAKILMFLPKAEPLTYGQSMLVFGEPQKISPPLNPDEFDYQKHMHYKGISHRHYIKPERYILTDLQDGRLSIKGLSLRIRDQLSRIIDSSFTNRQAKAIMLALMTGQRDYLNEDNYNSFIQTGIIHVLAISGLHVGIIYMFLLFLLKPLHRKKWSKALSYCLKIFILIIFAFITGLSPSVMRATLMFVFMIIGKMLNRNSHVLNSVFSSFFILLLIDPFKLFDVGFQLSYSAVLGIILFHPLIFKVIKFRFIFFNWIWQLSAISIAAQFGTLPFSLYYFKQFPTYFLLGNIFAIPFVFIATILGFITIPASFIPYISYPITSTIEFLTIYFLKLISVLQSLPYGLIKPIQIEACQGIMLSVLIMNSYLVIRIRNWKLLFLSLGCVIGIISFDIKDKVLSRNEKGIIIYNLPNISCIELVDGNTSFTILKDVSKHYIDKINYHVINHIVRQKRKTELSDYSEISRKLPLIKKDGHLLICWNGKSIAILNGDNEIKKLKGMNIDYMVISNSNSIPEDLRNLAHRNGKIIWDSSNSYGLRMAGTDQLHESIHLVPIHGPFIEQFND